MSRAFASLLLLLFAALICAPAVAWALGVKGGGTALQNRNLAKRPPLTFAKVWDGSFGKEFPDFVWDTIPLRDKALKMDHKIDFYVFRDSPSRDAFFGLDGFTWRRERVLAGIRAGGGEVADVKKAIDKIEKAFADAHVDLRIVLSPTKASIYREYIPDGYRQEYEKIADPVERFYRERAAHDPVIVDVWTPLLEEKARLLALPESELARPEMRFLWRKNDDHWNIEAGRIQAREIVRSIDPTLWDETKAPIFTGEFEMQEAELSRLYFKLDIQEPYQAFKLSPLTKVTMTRRSLKGSTNPLVTATSAVTSTHTPRDETVLVIRDSMLSESSGRPSCTRDGAYQTIAPFFSKTIFSHWETLQTAHALLKPRLRGVDHVVLQVTQGSNYYLVKRANELVRLAQMIKDGQGQEDDGTDPPPPTKKPERAKPKTAKPPAVPSEEMSTDEDDSPVP